MRITLFVDVETSERETRSEPVITIHDVHVDAAASTDATDNPDTSLGATTETRGGWYKTMSQFEEL